MDPDAPLARYNWLESYCRLLQQHVAGGLFARERFEGCAPLAAGRFCVITAAHLLCVAPQHANESREAEVVIVIPIACLLTASNSNAVVRVSHMSPTTPMQRRMCSVATLQRAGGELPLALAPYLVACGSTTIRPRGATSTTTTTSAASASSSTMVPVGMQAATSSRGTGAAAAAAAASAAGVTTSGAKSGAPEAGAGAAPASPSSPPRSGLSSGAGGRLGFENGMPLPLPSTVVVGSGLAGLAAAPAHTAPAAVGSGSGSGGLAAAMLGMDGSVRLGAGGPSVPGALGQVGPIQGGSVPGWLGVTRLEVGGARPEAQAAELAALLRGLLRAQEGRRWSGGCCVLGFGGER